MSCQRFPCARCQLVLVVHARAIRARRSPELSNSLRYCHDAHEQPQVPTLSCAMMGLMRLLAACIPATILSIRDEELTSCMLWDAPQPKGSHFLERRHHPRGCYLSEPSTLVTASIPNRLHVDTRSAAFARAWSHLVLRKLQPLLGQTLAMPEASEDQDDL